LTLFLTNITQYFDDTAKNYPERVAVYEGESTVGLAALRTRCLKLAGAVSAQLEGRIRQIVAVYLPKSIDSIAADIAVIYSGNAYMNLDIKSPAQRISNILEQIRGSLIVTSAALFKNISGLAGDIQVLVMDDISDISPWSTEDEE
jgi:non-ribosomal peptide synthetase component F